MGGEDRFEKSFNLKFEKKFLSGLYNRLIFSKNFALIFLLTIANRLLHTPTS